MTAPDSTPAHWLAVFDLDGTLTWHDTLVLFLRHYLRTNPRQRWRLWRLPFIALGFLAIHRDRGRLKSDVIRCVMQDAPRGRVDACAAAFVAGLRPEGRFRGEALEQLERHRRAGDRLVLLSASPDLYVPRIGHLLGVELTLCTEVRWHGDQLDGALVTANRRGAEKTRCLEWLRGQYPGLPIVAYGNSASDLDHMRHADRALLVNASAAARREAAQSGIGVADWR